MSIITIERSRDAGRTDRYISDDPAHDGSEQRVWYESAVGTLPSAFLNDLRKTREVMGKDRLAVETYHVVQSFTANEYNPDDFEDGATAHQHGVALAKKAFPGHQAKVSTQKDGTSGLWHNHIQIANVSHVSADVTMFDRSGGSWIEHREAGKPASTGLANIYRIRAINDEVAKDLGGYDNKALIAEHSKGSVRVNAADTEKRAAGRYNWRDDLRHRIEHARDSSENIDQFIEALEQADVEVRQRGKDKKLSYGFTDTEGKNRQARGHGRAGLGTAYTRDGVLENIAERQKNVATKPKKLDVSKMVEDVNKAFDEQMAAMPSGHDNLLDFLDNHDDFPAPKRRRPRKPAEKPAQRPKVEKPAPEPAVAPPPPVIEPETESVQEYDEVDHVAEPVEQSVPQPQQQPVPQPVVQPAAKKPAPQQQTPLPGVRQPSAAAVEMAKIAKETPYERAMREMREREAQWDKQRSDREFGG